MTKIQSKPKPKHTALFPALGGRSTSGQSNFAGLNTYVHNRGTSSGLPSSAPVKQRRKKKKHKLYSERLSDKHQTKIKLTRLLGELGETDTADRLRLCGSRFVAVTCGNHIVERKPFDKCDFRLCPFCAERRKYKLINKYLAPVNEFVKRHRVAPVHLVLTQKKKPGESLKDSRSRLLKSFNKLKDRKFFNDYFSGGLYAVETTASGDGWHTHLHVFAFRKRFFDISLLRAEWLAVTGDSVNLRLDKIDNIGSGLTEVLKYIAKPLDIKNFNKSHIREFLQIKGAKMFGKFGDFGKFCRDYETDESGETEKAVYYPGDCCPVCENPLFELTMTTEQLIAYAQKLESIPKKIP